MKNPVKRREWKDLADKPVKSEGIASPKEPYYPSLYLDSNKIGILPIDIDSEVTFIIQAKVVSLSKNKEGKISYTFDLKKLKTMPMVEDDTDDMVGSMEGLEGD